RFSRDWSSDVCSSDLLVVNGDPRLVGGGRHARHHQATPGVVLVGVLLDRALAAGAHATERGVPAEVRHVEAEGQAGLQQVVRPVDFVRFAVYMNSGHGYRSSYPPRRVWLMGIPCAVAPGKWPVPTSLRDGVTHSSDRR